MGAKIIGATIKLSGEKEFNSAVKSCTASLKNMQSGLKLIETQNSGQANTMESLERKHVALQRVLDASKEKHSALSKALEHSRQDYDRIGSEISQYEEKLDEEKRKLAEITNIYGESSQEAKEQQKVVDELAKTVENGYSAYQRAGDRVENWSTRLNEAEIEVEQTNQALEQNEKYLDEARNSVDKCAHSIDEYGKETRKATTELEALVEGASGMMILENVGAALEKVGESIGKVSDYVIEVGSTFEFAMSNVQALSGATGDDLDALSEKAKALGSSTQFSASQVADAFGYMSLAGWDVQQSLEGIDGILDLSASSGMELAASADMVTAYLSAFNLEAKDATRIANMLASAQSSSMTTAEELGAAYGQSAANLSSAGQSIETVTALLEGMANQGGRGSAAGTQLSAVMAQITNKMEDGAIAIGDTSVKVQDSEGNFRDLIDILADVSTATEGMGTAQRSAALSSTFNRTSLSGLNLILNEGIDNIRGYRQNLEQADGAAASMAATMQDNLQGKMTAMQSAMEGLGIAAYQNIQGPMTTAVDIVTKGIGKATDALEDMPKPIKTVASSIGLLTVGAGKMVPKLASAYTVFKQLKTASDVAKTLNALSAAQGVATVATEAGTVATGAATVATEGFTAALLANPIVLVTAGLIAGTAALAAFAGKIEPVNEEIAQLGEAADTATEALTGAHEALSDTLNTASDSIGNAQAAASLGQEAIAELSSLQSQTSLTADQQARQAQIVTELNALYPELNLSIDETTGKLSKSVEEIDNFAESVEKAAEKAAYEEAMKDVMAAVTEEIKAQTDAQIELEKVQEKKKQASKELADFEKKYSKEIEQGTEAVRGASGEVIYLIDARAELINEVDTLTSKEAELNEALDESKGQVEEAKTKANEYAEAFNNLTAAEEKNAEAAQVATEAHSIERDSYSSAMDWYNSMSESQQATASAFTEKVNEMTENLRSSVETQMGLFDELNYGSETCMDAILQGLDSQIQGVTQWEQNLNTLIDMGVNQDLIGQLIAAGPETGTAVQAIVDSGAEGIAQLNEKWAMKENIISLTNEAGEALRTNGAEQIASGMDGVAELVAESGTGIVTGLVNAVNAASSEAEAAGKQLGKDTVDGVATGADTHSPSRATFRTGQGVGQGLTNGIKGQLSTVRSAGTQLGQAAISGVNSAGMSSSAHAAGVNFSIGLANGISAGRSGVISAATAVATAAISAAKSALQEHSPSKATEEMGEYFDQGFINGVLNKKKDMVKTVSSAFNLTDAIPQNINYGTGSMTSGSFGMMVAAFQQALENADFGIWTDNIQWGRAMKKVGVQFG